MISKIYKKYNYLFIYHILILIIMYYCSILTAIYCSASSTTGARGDLSNVEYQEKNDKDAIGKLK